jgi:hypothetical protein
VEGVVCVGVVGGASGGGGDGVLCVDPMVYVFSQRFQEMEEIK